MKKDHSDLIKDGYIVRKNSLKSCPIDYDIENCSSKDSGLDCSTCYHMENIKAEIKDLLLEYMDYKDGFDDGYIPTLMEVDTLKIDILKLIQKIISKN